MFFGLGRKIAATLHPFGVIASEMQILRQLYELDLANRTDAKGNPAPIRRVTEEPSRHDTEVTYSGDEDGKKKRPDIFEDEGDWE